VRYISRAPRPVLASSVDRLWFVSDPPPHPRARILPSGTLELVVNLAEDEIRIRDPAAPRSVRRYPGALISGALTSSFGIDPCEHGSSIGVHFKPGGAFPFLGVSAFELADAHVDLEALWGRRARVLRDRLGVAPLSEKFTILEDALLDCLARPARRHPVVPFALAELSRSDVAVRTLAEHAGLSHRRLVEVFRAEVGMTPKTFSRVRRFERTLARARGSTAAPDWASLALECGYFDQSHMIRDFVALSGLTPLELFRRTSEIKAGHCVG
jgi:AraC-like DNA-binding protein